MNSDFKFVPLFLLIILASCSKNADKENIVIEGKVKNILGHKVYISRAEEPDLFLDSAFYNGKKFVFRIKKGPEFKEPFLAKLTYKDFKGKLHTLDFKYNKINTDAFMFEDHEILIEGDIRKKEPLTIKGGEQNEILNSLQSFVSFGDIPENTDNKKPYVVTYNKIIKQNPSSYFLINNIFKYKNKYTDSELTYLYNSFSKEVQGSLVGKGILNYIGVRTKPGRPFRPISFKDTAGVLRRLEYHQAKINVLVFWHSACAPCRRVIPALKAINKKFKEEGVELYSISMEENEDHWRKALAQESMNWTQLIIDGNDKKKKKDEQQRIETVFNVYKYPMLIITDYNGKELGRKIGYDKDFDYEGMVKKYLKS